MIPVLRKVVVHYWGPIIDVCTGPHLTKLRPCSQIIPTSCKNTVTKQSIRYICPKTWNELPEKIKLCKSLGTFVKKSKVVFLEQQLNLQYKLLCRSSFNIFCWSFFFLCFRKTTE